MDILSVNANRRQPPTPAPPPICGAMSEEGYTCIKTPGHTKTEKDPVHIEQHLFFTWTDKNQVANS